MPTPPIPSPELLAVCRGDAPADAVFVNARIVDVFGGEVIPGAFSVSRGRFANVFTLPPGASAVKTIDLKGAFVCPGLIDAHMHVESTMMPPSTFAGLASAHGTASVVADPHEIANVLGAPGIRWMMENGRGAPVRFLWAVSSCVPSCHLETSGARLEVDDLRTLFDNADADGTEVVALAEMMNFPGVVNGDASVLAKVGLGLARRIVDGHAPRLSGPRLQAYVSAGISSDHECTSADEAREKLRLGMRVFIRQGSAARNLEAMLPLVTPATKSRFCFCTDDRHPADLLREGHIDHVVRLAIEGGLDPVTAITLGTLNTAEHYRRADLGAIAPGRHADFVVFDDLGSFVPRQTYSAGVLVAEDGASLSSPRAVTRPCGGGVTLPGSLSASSFRVPAPAGASTQGCRIRVIGMDPRQIVTEHLVEAARVEGGVIVADPVSGDGRGRDILKLAVIERHRGSGNIGLGFVKGFGFSNGAIASTVGHDAHNLAVVGDNDEDMLVAARALADCGGGQCAVRGGRALAVLPLPIAGLMSDWPAPELIARQHALHEATRGLGCPHADPFMPLSFLPLPVIPRLKLSDLGLVDVERFEVVAVVVG
ncbi:MAG: adenine deaminase [Phycisphaerales bacterium]